MWKSNRTGPFSLPSHRAYHVITWGTGVTEASFSDSKWWTTKTEYKCTYLHKLLWVCVSLLYQFRHTQTDTDRLCSAKPSQPEGIQDLLMTKVTLGIWFVLVICDPAFARKLLIYSRRQIKTLGSLLHNLWPVNRMWNLLACRSLRKVIEDHKVFKL